MPVEIKELIIKAVVSADKGQAESPAGGPEEKQKLVQVCVEEVLKVLKRDRER